MRRGAGGLHQGGAAGCLGDSRFALLGRLARPAWFPSGPDTSTGAASVGRDQADRPASSVCFAMVARNGTETPPPDSTDGTAPVPRPDHDPKPNRRRDRTRLSANSGVPSMAAPRPANPEMAAEA